MTATTPNVISAKATIRPSARGMFEIYLNAKLLFGVASSREDAERVAEQAVAWWQRTREE